MGLPPERKCFFPDFKAITSLTAVAAELESRPVHPDLMLFVVPRINPNLVITLNPIPVFIMGWDPDLFPPFRNPDPVYFPMAGRLAYYGWRRMNGSPIMVMVRGDNGRRMAILKKVV